MKVFLRYALVFVIAGCNSKKMSFDNELMMTLEDHSKELIIQEIHDFRFRLRHPSYNISDVKNYNESLFKLWLTDSKLFNELYPSMPLFDERQLKMLNTISLNNDPLDFNRFDNLNMSYNKKHIAVYSGIAEPNRFRLLLVENFNDSNRAFSSYKDEAIKFGKKIRSQTRYVQ